MSVSMSLDRCRGGLLAERLWKWPVGILKKSSHYSRPGLHRARTVSESSTLLEVTPAA